MDCALPSISTTSWPGGVSACSKNIQRCGMKLRVTPLSGLYNKIFIKSFTGVISDRITVGPAEPINTDSRWGGLQHSGGDDISGFLTTDRKHQSATTKARRCL